VSGHVPVDDLTAPFQERLDRTALTIDNLRKGGHVLEAETLSATLTLAEIQMACLREISVLVDAVITQLEHQSELEEVDVESGMAAGARVLDGGGA
jgi:hypothetical protein